MTGPCGGGGGAMAAGARYGAAIGPAGYGLQIRSFYVESNVFI